MSKLTASIFTQLMCSFASIGLEEESPCESDVWPGTDGDSGNSTVHSPEAPKPAYPYLIPRGEFE